MTTTERQKELLRKICSIFNAPEHELDSVLNAPPETYADAIKSTFSELVPEDLEQMTADDLKVLRELGYQTEEEKALNISEDEDVFKELTPEASATLVLFRGSLPVFCFEDLVRESKAIYTQFKTIKDETLFRDGVKEAFDLYRKMRVGYITQRADDLYELNLTSKL